MRTVKQSHRKITPAQRHELVQVFLNLGRDVAGDLCVEYGVARGYADKMVRESGKLNPHREKPRGGGNIAFGVNHSDPRWAWAVARGPVVAA